MEEGVPFLHSGRDLVKGRKSGKNHGMFGTPTYLSWCAMLQRCFNNKHEHYPFYGGRGISVDEIWENSFEAFYESMGKRPDGMTLERKDPNGNYTPENCSWVSHQEQCNNRRSTHYLEWNGITQSIANWSRELSIPEKTLQYRVSHGWTTEEALTTPVRPIKNKTSKGGF